MAYIDRLRRASFRGVPFLVAREERAGGRRVVVHEYPFRDRPYAEDLGRKAITYRVVARLQGPDYDLERDRLLAELERGGVGLYVSPRYGELPVVVPETSTPEVITRGESVEVSIAFVEAGRNVEPGRRRDTRSLVDTRRQGAIGGAVAYLDGTLKLAGLPGFVDSNAATRAGELIDQIEIGVDTVGSGTDAVAETRRKLAELRDDIDDRLRAAGKFSSDTAGALEGLAALPGDAAALLDVGEGMTLFGSTWSVPDAATPTTAIDRENQLAIRTLGRVAGVALAATAASRITPASAGDAIGLRDRVLALIDAEIEDAGANARDEVYLGLRQLRAGMVEDLHSRAAALPTRRVIELPGSLPALVVSQRVYGTPARELEIVARNRIHHPLFARGEIEILTDAEG